MPATPKPLPTRLADAIIKMLLCQKDYDAWEAKTLKRIKHGRWRERKKELAQQRKKA